VLDPHFLSFEATYNLSHMCTNTHTQTCICAQIHRHTNMHMCTNTQTHKHAYVHKYTGTWTCMCICAQIHRHTNTHMCTNTQTHEHACRICAQIHRHTNMHVQTNTNESMQGKVRKLVYTQYLCVLCTCCRCCRCGREQRCGCQLQNHVPCNIQGCCGGIDGACN